MGISVRDMKVSVVNEVGPRRATRALKTQSGILRPKMNFRGSTAFLEARWGIVTTGVA